VTAPTAAAPFSRTARLARLPDLLRERIVVLDGAMGTMLQDQGLDEAAFRGERFVDHPKDLRGDNDLLCLTQPEIVRGVHAAYLEAGADVISTNSFTATSIAQADYGLGPELVREMNVVAARLARDVADAAERADPGRPRYVAGSLGPTNRTASISPDVSDPAARGVSWEELETAYRDAAAGLVEGGADLLLVETIFDTLNAKAAIFAIESLFDELGERVPLIISGTIVDASGRTLSGQTVEAFWHSIRHADPLIVGLNCALGPKQLREHLQAAKWSKTDIATFVHERARIHRREWAEAGKGAVVRDRGDTVYSALKSPDDLLVVASGGPAGGFGARRDAIARTRRGGGRRDRRGFR